MLRLTLFPTIFCVIFCSYATDVQAWNTLTHANLAETAFDLVARKPLEFVTIKGLIGQGLNIRDEKEKL